MLTNSQTIFLLTTIFIVLSAPSVHQSILLESLPHKEPPYHVYFDVAASPQRAILPVANTDAGTITPYFNASAMQVVGLI